MLRLSGNVAGRKRFYNEIRGSISQLWNTQDKGSVVSVEMVKGAVQSLSK